MLVDLFPKGIHVYDLETMKNCFLYLGVDLHHRTRYLFEISDRKNETNKLLAYLSFLRKQQTTMMGFNNITFDYPILHDFITYGYQNYIQFADRANEMGSHFIKTNSKEQIIYNPYIPQLDLLKLNHFDNNAKMTSLKKLQFAMRRQTVESLPYSPHEPLMSEQMDKLIEYGWNDIDSTHEFGEICAPLIEMRLDLKKEGILTGDVVNFSDVKIGKSILVNRLGKNKCYGPNGPRQTYRSKVEFENIIFPIQFQHDKCNRALDYYNNFIYHLDKNKPKYVFDFKGVELTMGLGGLHGSVKEKIYKSDKDNVIKDVDVKSMYPSIAIVNRLYPKHLGEEFVDIYDSVKIERERFKKGTHKNAALKLAGNAIFGQSNDKFSPFYDPQYTFTTTINGQLQLLKLIEELSDISQIIQANTDGVTLYMPRYQEKRFQKIKKNWELWSDLTLEEAEFDTMVIRDVNNYLVLNENDTKAKGAYWYPKTIKDYEGMWHKKLSNIVIPQAVEAHFRYGGDIEDIISLNFDPFDYMSVYSARGKDEIYIGEERMSKVTRHYTSTSGGPMYKIFYPKGELGAFKRKAKISDDLYETVLGEVGKDWDARIHTKNHSKYEMGNTAIWKDYLEKCCNDIRDFNWNDVDFNFYVKEANQLCFKS